MGDIVKFLDARDSSYTHEIIVLLKAHSKWHPGNNEEEEGGGMNYYGKSLGAPEMGT